MSDNTETSEPIEPDDDDADSDDGEEDALTPELDVDELPVSIGGP
jgi:hypothetical protein